ncbi:hypothetical protein [Ureibacillus massiliensis]|uniref:hypothetical protein n=1 Tax=Ureibacillus massiliensis TaxID=292806 RepID=UPI0006894E2A|nr:hypothetical protein [Ureibacillus massiliensis]
MVSQIDKKKPELEESKGEHKEQYVEILGDTISGNQLITAIIFSVLISLAGFLIGQWIFPQIADEQMVDSYSLLLGIAGTVIMLVINSFIFRPKRILVDEEISYENMEEVFSSLQLDIDEELRLIEEDPTTKKELEDLGVLSIFNSKRKED